jgi:hypothetical protein
VSLTKAQRDALDVAVKAPAKTLLDRYLKSGNTRRDHLTYLRILADSGVSGLERALGDPSRVLPMLAALGFSSTLWQGSDR